jgi:hypothetical protein
VTGITDRLAGRECTERGLEPDSVEHSTQRLKRHSRRPGSLKPGDSRLGDASRGADRYLAEAARMSRDPNLAAELREESRRHSISTVSTPVHRRHSTSVRRDAHLAITPDGAGPGGPFMGDMN